MKNATAVPRRARFEPGEGADEVIRAVFVYLAFSLREMNGASTAADRDVKAPIAADHARREHELTTRWGCYKPTATNLDDTWRTWAAESLAPKVIRPLACGIATECKSQDVTPQSCGDPHASRRALAI